jgi:hypothetical protein
VVNVKPDNDEIEHVSDSYCPCAPRVLFIDDETGVEFQNGPLIVHNAIDCRETVENAIGQSLAPDKGWTVWVRD